MLALLASLLEEGEPMPLYALKLLAALLDADACRWLPHIHECAPLPYHLDGRCTITRSLTISGSLLPPIARSVVFMLPPLSPPSFRFLSLTCLSQEM